MLSTPTPPARLVIGSGPQKEVVILKPDRVYQIGRGWGEDIHIWDPMISRHHASLREQAGHWVVTDEGSRNGLYIGTQRVSTIDLRDGLEFQLASTPFCFQENGLFEI